MTERGVDGVLVVPKSPVSVAGLWAPSRLLGRFDHEETTALSGIYQYVPWAIVRGPATYPEYRADCVPGEDADAGEDGGGGCGEMIRSGGPDWGEEWMRRHTQATGHRTYRRTVTDYVLLEPPDELRGRMAIDEAGSLRAGSAVPSGGLGRCDG
ncbi:hypothetical protein AB0A77_31120 [Streptomyces varsoviensis]|uniref:DUF7848 domain-containing protein n=1 Tax=Streptomyces varsoviensis TaxID=67373 RepID=UPI0034018CA4